MRKIAIIKTGINRSQRLTGIECLIGMKENPSKTITAYHQI